MRSFADRVDAGRVLAEAVAERLGADADGAATVVLGLPRGGVPVAAAVARRLGAVLDILAVRKIGTPGHTELAIGAIAGLAGSLYAFHEGFVWPNMLGVVMSTQVVLYVLFGGSGTLIGAVIGTVAIEAVSFWLSNSYQDIWPIILGVLLLPLAFARPRPPIRTGTAPKAADHDVDFMIGAKEEVGRAEVAAEGSEDTG